MKTQQIALSFLVSTMLTLASGCATSKDAAQPLNQTDVDAVIPVTGEKLLAAPPAGWQKIYSLNNGQTRLTDFVPESETASEWSKKLSFESHESLTETDPISILMGELEVADDVCEPIQSFNLFSGNENNYPTSVRLTFCGENAHSGEGEIAFSKVIQGNDYLYIIKLIQRVPAFEDSDAAISEAEIAAWSAYFREITLCDDRNINHSCPSTPDA